MTRDNSSWSSMDPLSIPLTERTKQLDRGNIVPNPLFEAGDSWPLHWEKVGDRVEWIDETIRITREKAGEAERAEGVLSDFVDVIPGNYRFTYEVKLENIDAAGKRRGTKLYDAIEVRVLFYDDSKEPIDGLQYLGYKDIDIDASFKGFTFSNYWHIGSFGWAKVEARTYNYPFSEGDLPDNARYVRLFLGLRGSGTMWVDNIDYRFSKWNFTSLERLIPYLDRPIEKRESLIPTPKYVSPAEPIALSLDSVGNGVSPIILVPKDSSVEIASAAKLLKSAIDSEPGEAKGVRIVETVPEPVQGASEALVFSIGDTELFAGHRESLPTEKIAGKPQGYLIHRIQSDTANQTVIFLYGSDPIGSYYAVTTAVQLIDGAPAAYHHLDIVDFPDFLGRSYLLRPWATEEEMENDSNWVEWMSRLKLNKAYVGYGQTRGRKDWYAPDDLYRNGVKRIGDICTETGVMSMAIMLNPYYHFEFMPSSEKLNRELRYQWTHSSPEDLETLKSVLKIGFDAGAKTLMLMADDFVPHEGDSEQNYALYTPEDKERFGNLQSAHGYIINKLHTWLGEEYGDTRFEFCPPWYLNEFIDRSWGKAEWYFPDLAARIPEDVAIIWTGNTVRSLSIDAADIDRYRGLIGRYPMLWDNTLYARTSTGQAYAGYTEHYPGKVRMCSLFEPLDVNVPEDFHTYNDGRHMYTNGDAYTEIYRIKYSTVADFEWNCSSYDPDYSLWKTLVSRYGRETAIVLLEFNDAYFGLVSMCMLIERAEEAGGKRRFAEAAAEFIDEAKTKLSMLETLGGAGAGHDPSILTGELQKQLAGQSEKFQKIRDGGETSNDPA